MFSAKRAPARVKAAGPDDGLKPGQFRALVSVFGNEDSMGDVIVPGAFTQVLAEWKASGDPIPVVWSHKWGDASAICGKVLEAEETPQGLEILGQLLHLDTNETAAHVHGLLTDRLITQFSFAYDVGEGGWVETDDGANHPYGGYYEIKRFSRLYEVGPCLVGANQETALLAAKAAALARRAKAGRVLSQANFDALTAANVAISDVLASAEPQKTSRPSGRGTDNPPAEPSTAHPAPAKLSGLTPAQVLARATILKYL